MDIAFTAAPTHRHKRMQTHSLTQFTAQQVTVPAFNGVQLLAVGIGRSGKLS